MFDAAVAATAPGAPAGGGNVTGHLLELYRARKAFNLARHRAGLGTEAGSVAAGVGVLAALPGAFARVRLAPKRHRLLIGLRETGRLGLGVAFGPWAAVGEGLLRLFRRRRRPRPASGAQGAGGTLPGPACAAVGAAAAPVVPGYLPTYAAAMHVRVCGVCGKEYRDSDAFRAPYCPSCALAWATRLPPAPDDPTAPLPEDGGLGGAVRG